jgi:regulator of nucleoside diphosphate kinase
VTTIHNDILSPVLMLEDEHENFLDLVCAAPRATPGLALLWQELQRATVVPAGLAPDDVVRIDSRVEFVDLGSGEARSVRVVYPQEAGLPGLERVTGAIGAALIGLREGDTFEWRDTDELPRKLLVRRVEAPDRPRARRPARVDLVDATPNSFRDV